MGGATLFKAAVEELPALVRPGGCSHRRALPSIRGRAASPHAARAQAHDRHRRRLAHGGKAQCDM